VLLLLAVLGAAGWFGWHVLRSDDTATVRATTSPCRSTEAPPEPAAAGSVRLRVLNGTNRDGLAHELDKQLSQRGFHVIAVATSADRSRVIELRAQLERSRWSAKSKRAGVLTLVVGRDFASLSAPATASQHRAAAVQAAHPTASPCASASASS
jgi:phage tail sheath gpL-like